MADDPDEDPAGSDPTEPASSSQDENADGLSNADSDADETTADEPTGTADEAASDTGDEASADTAADETEPDGDSNGSDADDPEDGDTDGLADDDNTDDSDTVSEEDDTDDSDTASVEDDTDDSDTASVEDDSDATSDTEESADDSDEGESEEIPRLDGSDVDYSPALTELDGDDGGLDDDSTGGTPPGAPPAEPTGTSDESSGFGGTTSPPGAPPSGPTRSRPDESTADQSATEEAEGSSDADGSDASRSAGDDSGEGATEADRPAAEGAGEGADCEAAPPDDIDEESSSRGPDVSPIDSPPATPPGAEPTPVGGGGSSSPMAEDDGTFSGPPDDEEMPLTEHINEMVGRLAAVAIIAAGVAVLSYPISGDMITWMWYTVHPGAAANCVGQPLNPAHGCAPPHVYSPLEFILTKLKWSGLVGLVVAIPFAVYQTYLFMKPGLYPSERRYYLASVPLSLVLALMGISFAFVVILPLLFEYFLEYTAETVDVAFQLADTIDLMLVLMGWTALTFQIPLLMSLAVMMGIVSRRWMKRKRIYFWGGFGAIGFFFVGADPTGMASVLLTITMIILFEVTLLLLRWTGR